MAKKKKQLPTRPSRQKPPPPRTLIVAREHDDFGRPLLVLDPVSKQRISTDVENPTSVVMNEWWARRLADRSITVVPAPPEEPPKKTRSRGGK
jgi:hypothetical protein